MTPKPAAGKNLEEKVDMNFKDLDDYTNYISTKNAKKVMGEHVRAHYSAYKPTMDLISGFRDKGTIKADTPLDEAVVHEILLQYVGGLIEEVDKSNKGFLDKFKSAGEAKGIYAGLSWDKKFEKLSEVAQRVLGIRPEVLNSWKEALADADGSELETLIHNIGDDYVIKKRSIFQHNATKKYIKLIDNDIYHVHPDKFWDKIMAHKKVAGKWSLETPAKLYMHGPASPDAQGVIQKLFNGTGMDDEELAHKYTLKLKEQTAANSAYNH